MGAQCGRKSRRPTTSSVEIKFISIINLLIRSAHENPVASFEMFPCLGHVVFSREVNKKNDDRADVDCGELMAQIQRQF